MSKKAKINWFVKYKLDSMAFDKWRRLPSSDWMKWFPKEPLSSIDSDNP
jgi:hypothetical protein